MVIWPLDDPTLWFTRSVLVQQGNLTCYLDEASRLPSLRHLSTDNFQLCLIVSRRRPIVMPGRQFIMVTEVSIEFVVAYAFSLKDNSKFNRLLIMLFAAPQPVGGAVRNATSLIPQRLSYIMLAITCSENVPALPCIDWPRQQYDTSHHNETWV